MTRFIIGLAAAFGLTAPCPAQTANTPSATAPAARITVPFNPPLDRAILYRHSKRVVDRRGDVTVTTNIRLRFTTQPGGGFRAEVTQLDARMTPSDPVNNALFQRMFEMYNLPYVMLFDTNGNLTGVEDEAHYWEKSIRHADQLLTSLPGTSEEQRALTLRVLDMFRAMPADQRRALLTETIAPVFDVAGGSWPLGEPVESDTQRTNTLGVVLTERRRVLAERVDGGRLFMSSHASIPSADLIAATERFYDRIPLNGRGNNTPEGRAEVLRQLRASEIRQDTDRSYEVEMGSGLIRRYRSVETASVTMPGTAGSNKVTTIQVEQVD